MKTTTINLYTAAELKTQFPKAFESARSEYNDTTDHGWWYATFDDFQEIAALMGFQIESKDIQFSGFSSQGDGASFTGVVEFKPDALETVKAHAPQDEQLHRIAAVCADYGRKGIKARLTRLSRHYVHEYTVRADAYTLDADGDESENLGGYDNDDVTDTCRNLMKWLYRQLEKEAEYRASDECFLETAEANEWTFEESGRMHNL